MDLSEQQLRLPHSSVFFDTEKPADLNRVIRVMFEATTGKNSGPVLVQHMLSRERFALRVDLDEPDRQWPFDLNRLLEICRMAGVEALVPTDTQNVYAFWKVTPSGLVYLVNTTERTLDDGPYEEDQDSPPIVVHRPKGAE